jgi:hypothetical protein
MLFNSSKGALGIDTYEIDFMVDGVVVSTSAGGSVSSSSVGGAAEVFDGSTSTRWASDFSGTWPQWVKQDFGATPRAINSVSFMDSHGADRAPGNFEMQYSDDGTTWTDAFAIADTGTWTINQTKTWNW